MSNILSYANDRDTLNTRLTVTLRKNTISNCKGAIILRGPDTTNQYSATFYVSVIGNKFKSYAAGTDIAAALIIS